MKTILISSKKYSEFYKDQLENLVESGCKLFCIVGVDCDRWEDAIDCILEDSNLLIPTTSHPEETEEDVIEFAKSLYIQSDQHQNLRVIRI